MEFGDLKIESVSGGRFRLDGGAMFGVVPKPLWHPKSPADDFNRIQLDTNCLLIRNDDALILCDTGFGAKLSDKERLHIDAVDSQTLVGSLETRGIRREEITHVIFSHLHFDHAGGATQTTAGGGELEVTFPHALHVVQRQELNDALGQLPELTGSYYEREIRFLCDNAQFQIIEGNEQLVNGIELTQTGGHTFGHQAVWIGSQEMSGVYLGDLCPTVSHLKIFWTMSYDAYQLEVRRKKMELLTRIADEKAVLFFDHDPDIKAATIRRKNESAFEVDQVIDL